MCIYLNKQNKKYYKRKNMWESKNNLSSLQQHKYDIFHSISLWVAYPTPSTQSKSNLTYPLLKTQGPRNLEILFWNLEI